MINHRGIQNGAGKAGEGRCKIWIDLSSLLKEVLSLCMILSINLAEVPNPPLISLPGSEALWRLSHGALPFGINYGRPDSGSDSLGNLILDSKYVCKVSVISLGPNIAAKRRSARGIELLGSPVIGLSARKLENPA